MLFNSLQTSERLRIRISPTNVSRFEVPLDVGADDDEERFHSKTAATTAPLYRLEVGEDPDGGRFFFKVLRRSTGREIFSADLPGFVFSNQFIQLPARLPSRYFFSPKKSEYFVAMYVNQVRLRIRREPAGLAQARSQLEDLGGVHKVSWHI